MQWFSYAVPATGNMTVSACSEAFNPKVALRTDAKSAGGGGVVQLPGCGTCDEPLT